MKKNAQRIVGAALIAAIFGVTTIGCGNGSTEIPDKDIPLPKTKMGKAAETQTMTGPPTK